MARGRRASGLPEIGPRPQGWRTINFDSLETVAGSEEFWRPGWSRHTWNPRVLDLVDLLALPVGATIKCPFTGWSGNASSNASLSASRLHASSLVRLPVDVLKLIFDAVQSLEDAVFLCLAHEYLGASGERRVYELILRDLAPWRGQRIAAIREATRDTDYPPQLQQQVDEWSRSSETRMIPGRRAPTFVTSAALVTRSLDESPPVHHPLRNRIEEAGLTPTDRTKAMALLQAIQAVEGSRAPAALGDTHTALHFFGPPSTYPPRTTAHPLPRDASPPRVLHQPGRILCNLSKGEFVRDDAVRELHDRRITQSFGAGSGWVITLGQALLSMISWSSERWVPDTEVADIVVERLSRGPWAGDRFEVVAEERMDPGMAWRDVTEDVVGWLEQVWVADWALGS